MLFWLFRFNIFLYTANATLSNTVLTLPSVWQSFVEVDTPFLHGVPWQRQGVKGIICSWGDFRRKIFHWNIQPLESLPQGSGEFPSVGYCWDWARWCGPSCLDCAFIEKGWTRWSLTSRPNWYSMILCFYQQKIHSQSGVRNSFLWILNFKRKHVHTKNSPTKNLLFDLNFMLSYLAQFA